MLKRRTVVDEARCDSCGDQLLRQVGGPSYWEANYGLLTHCFGFGSGRDRCGSNEPKEYHLCGECWDKALGAVGLKPADSEEEATE